MSAIYLIWKKNLKKLLSTRVIRFLQLFLLFVVSWFIFWAHIYEIAGWNKTFLEYRYTFNVLSYSASILVIILLEIYVRRTRKIAIKPQSPPKTLEELQTENELLKHEIQKSKQTPSPKSQNIRLVRLLQILLVFVASWFIYWAHIYEITVWNKTFLEYRYTFNVLSYSASILVIILLEIYVRRTRKIAIKPQSPPKTLEELQTENELLKHEIQKSKQTPSPRIGIGFLISGTAALLASVAASSTVLAFIGLGLAFWGGIFLFTRPVKFVKSTILDSTAMSSYTTIDRITEDLAYKGKPLYIPPYPKNAYLPQYLRGLKEMIVYIPAEDAVGMPTIEEMAKKQFLLNSPKGICIAPPGYGLVSLFEKELKAELTQTDMAHLYSSLPTIITKNLELAKEFEINQENDFIHVKIVDSVYGDLYSNERGFKSLHLIGCPLTSAIACAIAKTTGKLVTIVKDAVSLDLKTMEAWYQTLEV